MGVRMLTVLALLLAVAAATPVVQETRPLPRPHHNELHQTRPLPRPILHGELHQTHPVLTALALRDTGNANDYIDLVLDNLNALMPAKVPIADLGSIFHLKDCYMFGLDNGFSRSGDATMVTVDNTAKFTSSIKSGELGIRCQWHDMLLRGHATGTTDVIDVSSGFELELTSGSSPVVTEFRVTEVADIQTDITGLTFLFNWLAEDIADLIINAYKDAMVSVIEVQVKDMLQLVLDQIVIP